jgi:cell shape-determining protein MreC
MDIKDLNKSQFILLIILVCFIVSIATSITTYSLLAETPESIRNPITQVVQKTVERIVEVEKERTLTDDEQKLLADLKALKPLIDKLNAVKENPVVVPNPPVEKPAEEIPTENPKSPENPTP